jgi:hypothetical protein
METFCDKIPAFVLQSTLEAPFLTLPFISAIRKFKLSIAFVSSLRVDDLSHIKYARQAPPTPYCAILETI